MPVLRLGLAHLPDFAYPCQGLARGVLFRASPEEVRTVVHDAVVVILEAERVDLLRGELVEVVLLTHHHVLTLYLHPVIPAEEKRKILILFVRKYFYCVLLNLTFFSVLGLS